MAIILDADVVIRGEKGTFDFANWVASRPNDQFEIAAITVAELWHGVERATGSHKTKREHYLRTVLAALPIIGYTEQTAYEHARIWAALESSGKMIGFYDLKQRRSPRSSGRSSGESPKPDLASRHPAAQPRLRKRSPGLPSTRFDDRSCATN